MNDPADDIVIRRLGAADTEALASCFTRCYGNSYVVTDFYDPEATAARVREGTLRSVVAVTPAGEIVGHMGLTIRDPRALTVDAGNSIVDPRCRGRQIVARLAAGVIELCREGGFLGFHHYPTTVHPIMQKLAVNGGGIETGIMLDYIPSGTEYREIEGDARQDRPAVVVVYQPLRKAPHREVFAPDFLGVFLERLYAHESLPRSLGLPADTHEHGPTQIRSAYAPRRGLLRIDVERSGADLTDAVSAAAAAAGAAVAQVDLAMSDAATPAACAALRGIGFFFSAVLPEYLDGDVLRVQRTYTTASARPDLVTAGAQGLLQIIEADRARAERG